MLIDAKQWRRKDSYGAMSKAANLQYRRAIALKKNIEVFSNLIEDILRNTISIRKRLPFILVPIMVTLDTILITYFYSLTQSYINESSLTLEQSLARIT